MAPPDEEQPAPSKLLTIGHEKSCTCEANHLNCMDAGASDLGACSTTAPLPPSRLVARSDKQHRDSRFSHHQVGHTAENQPAET